MHSFLTLTYITFSFFQSSLEPSPSVQVPYTVGQDVGVSLYNFVYVFVCARARVSVCVYKSKWGNLSKERKKCLIRSSRSRVS